MGLHDWATFKRCHQSEDSRRRARGIRWLNEENEELWTVVVCCRLTMTQQEVVAYKEKVGAQNQELADYELEVKMLRRQLESLENEREKDRKMIEQLQDALSRAREASQLIQMLYFWRAYVYWRPEHCQRIMCHSLEQINYILHLCSRLPQFVLCRVLVFHIIWWSTLACFASFHVARAYAVSSVRWM